MKIQNLNNFKEYSFSKYTTNDILFNGNRGAIGTGLLLIFTMKIKRLLLATYDGNFCILQNK